jgi:hypothetical protein
MNTQKGPLTVVVDIIDSIDVWESPHFTMYGRLLHHMRLRASCM